KGVRVPTVAEGRWAALVARQTVAAAQVQGEREAEVFGESNDEGVCGQTKEALVVEPAENESAAYLLVVPTAECAPTLGDCEETHPPPSPSVAFVSGATPECVGGKPSDRDNCNQGSAPRERKRLQLKPRSVSVEANQGGDAAPKAAKVAPQASSSIFGGVRPVDTASREREMEARLTRQREEEKHRLIRHRQAFRTVSRTTRCGALVSPRVHCHHGVPQSLTVIAAMMEGGNRCRGTTAMTAVSIRKVVSMVLGLAMMRLFKANRETLRSIRQLTTSTQRTLKRSLVQVDTHYVMFVPCNASLPRVVRLISND
ncbi:hypothetical protein MTO96_040379, partial [Rhipicephalus appendiculatus]